MTQKNQMPEEIRKSESRSLLVDHRNRIWLWHLLLNEYRTTPKGLIYKPSILYIAKKLRDTKFRSQILENYNDTIINKSQFEWISDKDNRQIGWIEKRVFSKIPPNDIKSLGSLEHPKGLCITEFGHSYTPIKPIRYFPQTDDGNVFFALNYLSNRDLVILTFDLDKAHVNFKIERLKNLQNEWEIQANRDVKFDWFKENTFRKIHILKEIIQKNNEFGLPPDINFIHHFELLEYFDGLPNLKDESINKLIKKCKGTYDQGVRRERNTGKRQYSAELKITTIDKLKALANTYNFSVPQIIEIIVKSEYKERLYLKREEKLRKQLLEPIVKENKDDYI